MLKKTAYWLSVAVVGTMVGLTLQFAKAWTEPSAAPPAGNIGAPINTGATEQTRDGRLNVTDTVKVDKLRLGDKWLFSGIGDAHANDGWLRMFDQNGGGYYGGLAVNDFYTAGLTGNLALAPQNTTTEGGEIKLKTAGASAFRPFNQDWQVDVLMADYPGNLWDINRLRFHTRGSEFFSVDSFGRTSVSNSGTVMGKFTVCEGADCWWLAAEYANKGEDTYSYWSGGSRVDTCDGGFGSYGCTASESRSCVDVFGWDSWETYWGNDVTCVPAYVMVAHNN